MKALERVVTEHLSVGADDLFELITSVQRLPEWNAHIHHVVTAPATPVRPDDEWVVAIRVFGRRWNSRSRALEIDPDARRLTVMSQTDDGNPSYTRWEWEVRAVGEGSEVSVRWELNPKTFWRKVLFARVRHRQLRSEVGSSLRAAERVAR